MQAGPAIVNVAMNSRRADPPKKTVRTVRSFVRRSGRLTPGQSHAIQTLWPRYGIDYSAELLNLAQIFGRDAPRTLEIGFGNGESLVIQAAASRNHDFIGIEVHRPGVGRCLLQAQAAELGNLRIICHDAMDVLHNQLSRTSLTRINLYFPDPWPKKRHHKRRLVNKAFLQLVADRLEAGGTLHIATDWFDYAEHIDEVMHQAACFELVERRVHCGERALDRPVTRFEQRGLKRGHRIVDWMFVRN